MAVQSLSQNNSSSLEMQQQDLRGRRTMDQEKMDRRPVSHDSRSRNDAPSQKTAVPRWRFKGKETSSIDLACTWVVEHQIGEIASFKLRDRCTDPVIGIAVNLLTLLFLTHILFPRARHHTQKFFSISYYNARTHKFALGWDDLYFVLFWIVLFTGLRCATMDYVLAPLAGWAGIAKKKPQVRFAEQAWILLYPGFSWSCGMVSYTS